ncbi:MAG: plastocyanin/azurin family copper-binding protein [Parafilimonas sp.]
MSNVTMFLRSSLLILCSVILLNGCSSPSGETEDKTSTQETPEEKPAPSLYVVQIEQMKFLPADITVHAGDTIMWINNDMVGHDVTEEKSKAWSSSLLPPGKSWKFVPKESADYYCSIHVVMKGSVTVK